MGAKPLVADVTGQRKAAPPLTLDRLERVPGVFALLEVDDRDIGASRANSTATARPIPLSPPVISTTLSCSRPLPG